MNGRVSSHGRLDGRRGTANDGLATSRRRASPGRVGWCAARRGGASTSRLPPTAGRRAVEDGERHLRDRTQTSGVRPGSGPASTVRRAGGNRLRRGLIAARGFDRRGEVVTGVVVPTTGDRVAAQLAAAISPPGRAPACRTDRPSPSFPATPARFNRQARGCRGVRSGGGRAVRVAAAEARPSWPTSPHSDVASNDHAIVGGRHIDAHEPPPDSFGGRLRLPLPSPCRLPVTRHNPQSGLAAASAAGGHARHPVVRSPPPSRRDRPCPAIEFEAQHHHTTPAQHPAPREIHVSIKPGT
jgi:hypothetical protein